MKRIICVMLTLLMLVSLVPMTAITASAATLSTSEAAITVLKNMSTFKKTCYQVADTQEFRIGYGTLCKEPGHKVNEKGEIVDAEHKTHTIGEALADKALREALTALDKKVNSFASNGLALKQNQFDALTVYSFFNGTAWMNGNGLVKTAVVNKAGTNDLLNAMIAESGSEARSKILVNMYVNKVYSNTVPGGFAKVSYDTNGGSMAQGKKYTMYFDTAVAGSHPAAPTLGGYKFLGWYIDGTALSNSLDATCANKELKALWQEMGMKADKVTTPTVNYKLASSKLASKTVYKAPDLEAEKTGTVVTGTSVTVLQDYINIDGSRWAKIGDGKWVMVVKGSNGNGSDSYVKTTTVTVTNSYVNARQDASVYSKKVATFHEGDKLYIIRTKNAGGFLWGEVAREKDNNSAYCWVALMYTNWNSVKDDPVEDNDSNNTSKAIAKATITFNGYVNLRNGAGTDNKIVGSLAQNETVEVYEIKTVNGHQWGRTGSGWFCMTYANVQMLSGSSDVSNEGSLAYTFPGVVTSEVYPVVDTTAGANETATAPEVGDNVSVISLRVAEGKTWAKIGWTVTENKKSVKKYGWIKLDGGELSVDGTPVKLKTAIKYTTVANEVTVRNDASSAAASVCKLSKGVEIEVTKIKLVGENIWGYSDNQIDTNKNGWVNLASKYVERSGSTVTEPDTPAAMNKTATIVGADIVNVRASDSTTSKKVGTVKRGATANILAVNGKGTWYKLDLDVDNDPSTDSWVFKDYVEVKDGTVGGGSGSASSSTGTGVVSNTYGGVNVRTGAGTAYAAVGKLLPGTAVEILETKYVGATKWGRTEKGWVCMDYITMISEAPVTPPTNNIPEGGTSVGDYDDAETTTTTAIYTGYLKNDVTIYATTEHSTEDKVTAFVRDASKNDPITIYELLAVTEVISGKDEAEGDHNSDIVTTRTTYWARVNDGYILNPEANIALDPLDEKTHTLVGSATLNVRKSPVDGEILGQLEKGDKVKVTELSIEKDKVWGKIDFDGENGWIRLDYMAEGAIYEQKDEPVAPQPPKDDVGMGNEGNTGNGGFVNNGGGYRYTGKVINTNSVNVRATASTTAKISTTLKSGASLVIYETTISEGMAWGRCDAGWIYLYYVDLTPCIDGAVDARVVYNDNTVIYTDVNCSDTAGTYSKMAVIDIYEIVGKMARTDLGWVNTDNLL